ncbi:MAG: hypothetical protein M4579_001746 [Chaenotheca gracillima]|nr:MAG: hypothetical protein M4579_001746 [Chaenotheca gracillima]
MFRAEPSARKSSTLLDRRFSGLSIIRSGSESAEEVRGPLGLTLLHCPFEPLIDFIFVHGLRGGSRKTWSKSANIEHFWPQQWLPAETRFKHVRIHSFGYNSDWGQRKGSALTVHDFGQALLGEIHNSPQLCGSGAETPIVLIGHSMGGIVIKKTFLLARQDPNYRNLKNRFHSMFFLATPHRGADSAQLLTNMLMLSASHSSKAYVGDLVRNSGANQAINDEFRHAYVGTQLWSFFETFESKLGLIVDKDSAVLGLPGERVQLLNADHRHVCKFDDPSDNNYCTIRNAFISTIDSIEKTWISTHKDEHRGQMRILSQYLGIPEKPEADLTSVIEKKVEGSCQWLTNSDSFQQWREGSSTEPKHYWLSGEPATGKSTIAGHVTKYLQDCNSECMYFFFKDGDSTKSTVPELLCSLAWQMASVNTDIRQVLLEMENEGESIDRNDPRSIWRTIFVSRVFQVELRQPCYWIIDALDECSSHNILFPLLAKIDKQYPLRVFITSRPSFSIERLFSQEKVPKITTTITRENSLGDIKLFLDTNSRYLPVDDEPEREELVQQVLDKANGNFLWASLVLNELETIHSKQQVHEVLKAVPEEMDGLYSRILQSIEAVPRNKDIAKAILKWTVCAVRPLTVEELKEALILDVEETLPRLEKTAGSICGHLVYVDNQLRVQVAHQTVRAFLFRHNASSEFAFEKQREHTRLSEVCLKYLCGDEMKTSRYRRGSASSRSTNRSAFADYATEHFSEHLARSTSSSDNQLLALHSFLQTNSLTWIEIIARGRDLNPLTQAAKNMKAFLERRAKYSPPLGKDIQDISAWIRDLIQLVARFGKAILASPFAIHFLVAPLCPPESILASTFKDYPRALRMVGFSQKEWDDQLCCIGSPETQALSVACRDNRFAIGASDGIARIYHATTFQEERKFTHGEPVRSLEFGSINTYLATAGRRKINIWNSGSGALLRTLNTKDPILTLGFSMDNNTLMAATQANSISFWKVADGTEIDTCQFSDVDHEQRAEDFYRRSPTHAAFSSELNLFAVTYRQRPVSVWDLEDSTFVGQFYKSATTYPGPLVFTLIFNSNPEICLTAVAYDDGDVVVFDPWTQKQQASVEVDAVTLASSPDGTVLAAGDGVGIITLFEFETLKMLYRVNSFEQNIRSIVFNSNNLRFFDIRGGYCNIWEPPVLVRRVDSGDSSSIGLSEEVPSGPQLGTVRAYDDDRAITAMVAHRDDETVFCGREDGSVAIYSTTTGKMIKELFGHTKYVAVLLIDYNSSGNLLASIDRSGHFLVRTVANTSPQSVSIGAPILDQKVSSVVSQLLLSPGGKRLLVSMAQSDQLWSLEDAALLCTRPANTSRNSWRWLADPLHPDKILLIEEGCARIFDWENLNELSKTGGIDLGFDSSSNSALTSLSFSPRGHCLCIFSAGSSTLNLAPNLRIWPTTAFTTLAGAAKCALTYDKLARNIKGVMGHYRSLWVFISYDGWVCSLNINDLRKKEQHYIKHFFVPFRFHSAAGDLTMAVTARGSVVLTHMDEVVVFQNGLDFEEEVDMEKGFISPKPSSRLGLKRGSSAPAV